jgi:multiple sugar transport system substrate-binding protein
MNKNLIHISGLVAATSLILAACGASTPPTPQIITKEVIKEVPKEVQVVVTKEVRVEVTKEVVKPAADKTTVTWYIGLGAGSSEAQIVPEKTWVEKYNKSQDKYNLVVQIVDNNVAAQNLKAQIAQGNVPDIVGPCGKDCRAAFAGGLLDITPLIKKYNVDTSKFNQALMDFVKDPDGQVGLPYAMFPAVIYYNKDLFKEAKLNPPPTKFGEKYKMPDGKEVDWNWATLRDIAMKLTVDKNGKDATQPGFDPKQTRQWGYNEQWANAQALGVVFGPVSEVAADGKTAKLNDNFKNGYKWVYDAVWKDHFFPSAEQEGSELLAKPNALASGNVAMAYTHSWFMCCMEGGNLKNWGVGVVPAGTDGKITVKMHGDTFSILKGSKQPDAAFNVMLDIMKSKELEQVYGGLPSGDAERQAFFAAKEAQFKFKPGDVNWQVFIDSIPYPDVPSHESLLPNHLKAKQRLTDFYNLVLGKAGLNMDTELAKLETDLQKIYDEAATK